MGKTSQAGKGNPFPPAQGDGRVLYKVLKSDGFCHHDMETWSLPTRETSGAWVPGEWMPEIGGELVAYKRGHHLYRDGQVLMWLRAKDALYEAECRGECMKTEYSIVTREARLLRRLESWDERVARLLACDYAERLLPLFERAFPGDDKPRWAIEIGRRYAKGQITEREADQTWAKTIPSLHHCTDDHRERAGEGIRLAICAALVAVGAGYDDMFSVTSGYASNRGYSANETERRWQYERLCKYLYTQPSRGA